MARKVVITIAFCCSEPALGRTLPLRELEPVVVISNYPIYPMAPALMTLSEDLEVGDFVALQGGRHAAARMFREEALEARRLHQEVFPDLAGSARKKAEGTAPGF